MNLPKKNASPNGRKHGMRAQLEGRLKTTLTFETAAQAYHWTTDRGRSRLAVKR